MGGRDQPPVNATLIRAADLVASPWKNGGGVTREIAVSPPKASLDDFIWRVSVADVASGGAFSRFNGIDRILVLLSGAGMTLVADGKANHILSTPFEHASFSGETAIDATLHDGPTRDFNLMTRRSVARGSVQVWRAGVHRSLDANVLLIFCAAGAMQVDVEGIRYTLGEMDTLRLDAPQGALDVVVSGNGALLAVFLTVCERA